MASHLVIQGPRLSFFTKHCPARSSPDSVTIDAQPAYDSAANILRIAESYRDTFDTIVVSTWDSEDLPHRARLEALGVVVQACPFARVAGLPNPLRQVVGVLEGVKAIENIDPRDRITKTRTDLWIDLSAFIAHAEQADERYESWRDVGQAGFIHSGNSRGPFFLEDMYITAHATDFARFWEASLPEFQRLESGGIHQSLPLEYAWQNRERLGLTADSFLDFYRWTAPWISSCRTLLRENQLWQYLMTHCFCLGPEIEESAFIWRGAPSNHQTNRRRLKRYQFFEQWQLMHDNEAASESLTDLQYFESRKTHGLRQYLKAAGRALRTRGVVRAAQ